MYQASKIFDLGLMNLIQNVKHVEHLRFWLKMFKISSNFCHLMS